MQLFVTARIIGRKCNRDEQASVITVIIPHFTSLEKISSSSFEIFIVSFFFLSHLIRFYVYLLLYVFVLLVFLLVLD